MTGQTNTRVSASKSEILDAAATVFMQRGADVASIDDVARHLGATKGRIYHHFPSKGVLLAEVCLRAADFTYCAVAPVIDSTASPEDNLRRMTLLHVPKVMRTLPYHKVILQTLLGVGQKSTTTMERDLHAQIGQERDRYEGLFRDVINRGIDTGEFRKQNVTVAVHSVLLLINAPVFWYSPRQNEPEDFADTTARQIAEMALRALQ